MSDGLQSSHSETAEDIVDRLGSTLIAVTGADTILELGTAFTASVAVQPPKNRLARYVTLWPESLPDEYTGSGIRHLRINPFDQSQPDLINRKYQLVVAIDAGLHVRSRHFVAMLDFLVSHTGKWLAFSGGRDHPDGAALPAPADWKTALQKRGMLFDDAATAELKKETPENADLMLFHRPERFLELDRLEDAAKPYIRDITAIVMQSGNFLEGNLFFVNLQDAINGMALDNLKEKRYNFMQMVRGRKEILEIGFNAGHSALIALLVNPQCRMTIVDVCGYPYIEPCFRYLSDMFPGRLTLIKGNSTEILPRMVNRKFDLVHYDGGKSKTIAADLDATRDLVTPGHTLVIDDTQSPDLLKIVKEYARQNRINDQVYSTLNNNLHWYKWKHCIAQFPDKVCDSGSLTRSNAILCRYLRAVSHLNLPGDMVECGAGSASVLSPALSRLKDSGRTLWRFQLVDNTEPPICDPDPLHRYDGSLTLRRATLDRLFLDGVPAQASLCVIALKQKSAILGSIYNLFDCITEGGYLLIEDIAAASETEKAIHQLLLERGISPALLDVNEDNKKRILVLKKFSPWTTEN